MIALTKIKITHLASYFLNDRMCLERYAAQARLPLAKLDDPEAIVPLAAARDLYMRIVRGEGLEPLISSLRGMRSRQLLACNDPIIEHNVRNSLTAKAALISSNPIGIDSDWKGTCLRPAKGGCWFVLKTHRHLPDTWVQDLIEIQQLKFLADTVLTGFEPRRIRIRAKRDEDRVRMLDRLGFDEVNFAAAEIGLWIPDSLLSLEVGESEKFGREESETPGKMEESKPSDFVSAVRKVLESYREDRWLTLAEFSDCVDIPVRTIQRRLAEENTSFSDLSIQARISAATCMLKESEHSVTEIAMDLGFSSASNFARAFRSFTGFSPGHLRRLSLQHLP